MPNTAPRPLPAGIAAIARIAPRAMLATLACCAASVMAQPRPGDGQPGQRGGPPAEALAACKTAKANDACSFTSPHGAVSGSCWAPQGLALACRPKDAPPAGDKPPAKSTK